MSPLSLVFSSDEETSRKLGQALRELDLDVEFCPEIFAAIEKITSRKFEVIATDWDEGLEASFLLKTSRELKSNQSAFTIAITSSASSIAAGQSGANLVLTKPILVDQAKYSMLTCDEFLLRMKTWLPQAGQESSQKHDGQKHDERSIHVVERPSPQAEHDPVLQGLVQQGLVEQRQAEDRYIGKSWPERPAISSPAGRGAHAVNSLSTRALGLATLESDPFHLHQRTGIQTIFSAPHAAPAKPVSGKLRSLNRFRSFLRGAALGVTFLSVGYAFSEPARSEAVAVSVTRMYEQAVAKTQSWLRANSDQDDDEIAAMDAGQQYKQTTARRNAVSRIRVTEVRDPSTKDLTTLPTELQSPEAEKQPQPIAAASFEPLIPESLSTPIENGLGRMVPSKGPSLLGGLEPVSLSSDIADGLVLHKVQPNYPSSALQAGLQGPVVLQAWIARDGTIRDLKLLNGSLLLGQAAYRAVKQWRYKPYLLDGRAVEAETLVTVDFRLPQ